MSLFCTFYVNILCLYSSLIFCCLCLLFFSLKIVDRNKKRQKFSAGPEIKLTGCVYNYLDKGLSLLVS